MRLGPAEKFCLLAHKSSVLLGNTPLRIPKRGRPPLQLLRRVATLRNSRIAIDRGACRPGIIFSYPHYASFSLPYSHSGAWQTFSRIDCFRIFYIMTAKNSVPTSRDVPRPVATRRARFRRDAPSQIRLTADDLDIIRHVHRHRFLRSTHLLGLLEGRSGKKLLERLASLYHNGYLDRPRAQLDYYTTAGSAPMVYAIGNTKVRTFDAGAAEAEAEAGGWWIVAVVATDVMRLS